MGLNVPMPGCHHTLLQPVSQFNIARYTLTVNGVFRHTMTPDSSSNTPVKLKANCKVVNVTSAQIYPSKYLRMLTVGQKGCRRKDMVDTSFQAAVWADPGCT